MAVAINTVLIGGHLTRDPQVRPLQNTTVANFALAINRRYKGNDGEMKEEVTFVEVECWGRTAELVGQYCTKGRALFVEGRLKLDQWQDKDGHNRQRLKVVAESVQFLGSNGREAGAAKPAGDQAAPSTAAKPGRAPVVGDDEPPF
jgi:single-strand DNA-binding protein